MTGALGSFTAGARYLSLGGTSTATNTIAGTIVDGTSVTLAPTVTAGTWVFSNANTFTGATTVAGGTLSLTNPLALQNSALNTTGSIAGTGSVGLKTNQTTLTLGGLTGAKNFASAAGVFNTTSGGYSGVTALTLNPGTGVTNSYTAVIADGAAGMSLTKTGLGTQTLSSTSINTYTGTTHVDGGVLQLDGSTHASSTVAVGTAGSLTASGTVNGNATWTGGGIINKASGTIVGALAVTIGTGALGFNDFVFSNLGGVEPGTYKLITSGAPVNGILDSANLSGVIDTLTGTTDCAECTD